MPTPPRPRILTRAAYARNPNTNGGFLVNDPDGFPSQYPPAFWWVGVDSGGGAYPIGPNGPWGAGTTAAFLPVVTRATALITGPLTSAPYRLLDAAGQPLPPPRWLTDPMLVRADARLLEDMRRLPAVQRLVRSLFWTDWLRSAIWFGVGAFIYEADAAGQPLAGTMRLLNPLMLNTVRVEGEGGALCWSLDAYSANPVTFDRDGALDVGPYTYRICVLRNPHSPIDDNGMSKGVFELSPQAFTLAAQIGAYASGQFRAGVPNGYLKTLVPGMTQTQADDLKTRWMAAHGGDRRSIAVLNSTTEFVPINLSPVDAALTETTRLNVADVAFAFGLDPMTLGSTMGNSATYSNIRDAWENHRDFGLGPWIAAVEDTMSALTPGTQAITVNLDGFANPPLSERVSTGAQAVAAGLITVDEWRAQQGWPSLPAAPLENSGTPPTDDTAPTDTTDTTATGGGTP